MDNGIDLIDQAAFLELRATGQSTLIQFTWIYDAIDVAGLRRFCDYLGRGLLARRIERSPLPFARDRSVVCRQPPTLDIATKPRAHADVAYGPTTRPSPHGSRAGPRLAPRPRPAENGGGAVSLVVSHCVADGIAVALAIEDAAKGRVRDLAIRAPVADANTRAPRRHPPNRPRHACGRARRNCYGSPARRHRRGVATGSPARAAHGSVPPISPSGTYVDLGVGCCAKRRGKTVNSLFGDSPRSSPSGWDALTTQR